uniref:Ragulator complex protein LAMTOR1 n=1 Tax=Syphacia muris TaxID=451379 RepID=A0A0N5ATU6_9BILA
MMDSIDLQTFEDHLDKVIDEVAVESVALIKEKPCYIYAVMVIAEDDDDSQIIQASRVKVINPVTEQADSSSAEEQNVIYKAPELLSNDDNKPNNYVDADIERALMQLEKSRDLLNER